MEKTCTGPCGETKPLSEFNKMARSKDGRQYWCHDCAREKGRLRNACTTDQRARLMKARNERVEAENRRRICEYLSEHPCVDCNEDDIVVLEFDHLRDKRKAVGAMMRELWPRIEEEIAKCDVVCANCHKRRTEQRRGSYRISYVASAA